MMIRGCRRPAIDIRATGSGPGSALNLGPGYGLTVSRPSKA